MMQRSSQSPRRIRYSSIFSGSMQLCLCSRSEPVICHSSTFSEGLCSRSDPVTRFIDIQWEVCHCASAQDLTLSTSFIISRSCPSLLWIGFLVLHKDAPLPLSRSPLADRIPFDTLYIIHRLALSAQYQVVQSSFDCRNLSPCYAILLISSWFRFAYKLRSHLGFNCFV